MRKYVYTIIPEVIYMAIRKEFGFPSRDGINTCHAYSWSPDDGNIRAIFQIVHGMEEYMDRYDDFASFMAGHGSLWLAKTT